MLRQSTLKWCLTLWILSLSFYAGSSKTHYVCSQCATRDLASALNLVEHGDSIIVQAGTYETESLDITKSITLIGERSPLIQSRDGGEILIVDCDSVRIEGLHFSGVKTNYLKENAAIRVRKSKYFSLINNEIMDCFFGIYLERASRGKVIGNRISGKATTEAESGNAIHAWHCKNIEIANNYLTGHRDGIYFEFVDDSKITNNQSVLNTRYGLHFMFSNDDQYLDNTFKDNGVGVAVMFSSRIKMIDNEFSYNWGRTAYGLLLKEMNDAEIKGNRFRQNTIGVFVEGSNRVDYQNNVFERNGWAIKFSGGCSANEIHKNSFINNSLDLIMGSTLSDNSFHHNFWSNYSGYDLDKNQVGDVPHYPVKLFSYVLDQVPEAIVLMRSLFVDIINFSEKVSPVFTPKEVFDPSPLMSPHDD